MNTAHLAPRQGISTQWFMQCRAFNFAQSYFIFKSQSCKYKQLRSVKLFKSLFYTSHSQYCYVQWSNLLEITPSPKWTFLRDKHKNMLSFCRLSPANNQASVIQSGTRNLPHSTYTEFSKHVCLQWLNPLGYYGTKSPPDPPKNRLLKALFMSGLWGGSNRPKDSVDRGFSTCYHWGHIPKDPIGQGLNKSPSTAD